MDVQLKNLKTLLKENYNFIKIINERNEFFLDRVYNHSIKVFPTMRKLWEWLSFESKFKTYSTYPKPFSFNLVSSKTNNIFMNVTDIFNDIDIEQIPFFYV